MPGEVAFVLGLAGVAGNCDGAVVPDVAEPLAAPGVEFPVPCPLPIGELPGTFVPCPVVPGEVDPGVSLAAPGAVPLPDGVAGAEGELPPIDGDVPGIVVVEEPAPTPLPAGGVNPIPESPNDELWLLATPGEIEPKIEPTDESCPIDAAA